MGYLVLREKSEALRCLSILVLGYSEIGYEGMGHLVLREQPMEALRCLSRLDLCGNQLAQVLREQPEVYRH